MSDDERKELNLKAERLIKSFGIYIRLTGNEFDILRGKPGYVGFAHYYLQKCDDESELISKADIEIYKNLLEIDAKLGTTSTEQLFWCVFYSVRMDIMKVIESWYLVFFKI